MSSSVLRAVSMMIGTRDLGAQDAAHVEAVHLGQHQVEHDQVGAAPRAASSACPPVVRQQHAIAVPLQIEPDQLRRLFVIVDHQYLTVHCTLIIANA